MEDIGSVSKEEEVQKPLKVKSHCSFTSGWWESTDIKYTQVCPTQALPKLSRMGEGKQKHPLVHLESQSVIKNHSKSKSSVDFVSVIAHKIFSHYLTRSLS